MEDQSSNLKAKGIACAHISSAQPERERQAVLRDLASAQPALQLVLVTPELIATRRCAALWGSGW
jgi:superfamily II DNA helicase RecQ